MTEQQKAGVICNLANAIKYIATEDNKLAVVYLEAALEALKGRCASCGQPYER